MVIDIQSSPTVHAPELPDNSLVLTSEYFLPAVSVECVIFGFHDNQLKVLLLENTYADDWSLVNGFVPIKEDVDTAAIRMLRTRTGLTDIFLRQFHLFGGAQRNQKTRETIARGSLSSEFRAYEDWLAQRFVSAGYYALVDYTAVEPLPDKYSKACAWWEIGNLPELIIDHQQIIDKALETLRLRLRYEPIGFNLLPEKFTMPQLQKLYEAILGRSLDRRNFQRKMLSYGILRALDERRTGGAHKAPRLHSFDTEAYQLALVQGLQGGW